MFRIASRAARWPVSSSSTAISRSVPTWPARAPWRLPPLKRQTRIGAEQDLYVDAYSEEVTGSAQAAEQMVAAIERNDFKLFCQRIQPLAADRPGTSHYEVLIRLLDEGQNTSSPGEFFPLVEKYGLMPKLDRWVVEQVIKWASFRTPPVDPSERSDAVHQSRRRYDRRLGFPRCSSVSCSRNTSWIAGTLCFEVSASDASNRHDQIGLLADRLQKHGCRIALSGFGRDQVSFGLLKDIKVDFLKIDGSIVLRINRDPLQLAKLKSVSRVAKTIGIKTVAEMVEDEATIAVLRNLGIDYAQGFGISVPGPLSEIA